MAQRREHTYIWTTWLPRLRPARTPANGPSGSRPITRKDEPETGPAPHFAAVPNAYQQGGIPTGRPR